jgi:RNA polymerase sigma-70 factor (ECF subfamily)
MESSDEQLLAGDGSHEFAVFYRRHARDVLAYFARRVRDAEAAADLTAETFAAAVLARERFRPDRGSAAAWLYGIASHKLADYERHRRLEDRARRQLGMARLAVTADDVVEIEALGRDAVVELLSVLPVDQREAVAAHVIDDATYEDLARRAVVTPSAMRHRVSRGLRALRDHLGEGDR